MMTQRQIPEEEIHKQIREILEDSRTHPPKPIQAKCNNCQNRIPATAKCKLYPTVIPKEILTNKQDCPEFKEK